MKQTLLAAALLASLMVAGCSENGGTPPGSSQASADPTPGQSEPATAAPAGPQFAVSTETQDGLAGKAHTGVCSIENMVVAPEGETAASDKPNTYEVNRDKVFRMVGFAVHKDKGSVPADVEIVLTGNKTYTLNAATGGDREDVAQFFKNPAFAKAGFMQDASFAAVEPGEYAMYILSKDGGEAVVCPTHQGVRVL